MNKFLLLAAAAFTFAFVAPAIADDHGHEAMVEETSMDEAVEAEVCHDAEGEEVECPEDMVDDVEGEEEAEMDAEEETMEESTY